MDTDSTPETGRVKASLSRLAGSSESSVIERGAEATADLETAASFVDSGGLDQLAAATDATDDPELERLGRWTLETFARFRQAALGEESGTGEDHFHHGRGTDLRCTDERRCR